MKELKKRKDQDFIEIDLVETITEYANKKNVLILDKRPLDLTDAVPAAVKSQEETDLFGEIPDLLNLAGE